MERCLGRMSGAQCLYRHFFGDKQATVVAPKNREQLEVFRNWVIVKGIPKKGPTGFWKDYHKLEENNVDDSSHYAQETHVGRKNRNLYIDYVLRRKILPDDRNQTQTGITRIDRVEQCTAQKKVHEKQYLGLDVYYMLDVPGAAVCERSPEIVTVEP